MRRLRYSINVSLDGCVDHAAPAFGVYEDVHQHAARTVADAGALIFGRTTYELMEFWRSPVGVPDWTLPFAEAIGPKKKYLVSSTRTATEWNTENLRGDPVEAVRSLKQQPGGDLLVGGVRLPLALADAGLIDEFEFVVHPVVAGRGPTLLAGLAAPIQLEQVGVTEFASGVVARRYVPSGSA